MFYKENMICKISKEIVMVENNLKWTTGIGIINFNKMLIFYNMKKLKKAQFHQFLSQKVNNKNGSLNQNYNLQKKNNKMIKLQEFYNIKILKK